ncbi:MAG: hypothetical protein JRJ87_25955 [Deltaproteobacteria bacterium]|nr:hypothetical protein [Deltaproteobacteria bacterium]
MLKTKVMRELLASLENRLASNGRQTPNIRYITEKMHAELEQFENEEGEVPDSIELPPVPLDSDTRASLKIGDLLAGRGEDKFPQHDAKLLLSAVWRKHAGQIYHMRWGDEGEIEVTLGNVMKLRIERMRNGVRLRFLRLRL